jgi:type IV pilus assembly protein PilA
MRSVYASLERGCPVFSRRRAFTLIELLIVVVIVGILAAIAIPKFASSKQKAYIASMKTDLRNLATVQEAYFFNANAYATQVSLPVGSFHASAGNSVSIISADQAGWSASATNAYVPSTSSPSICGIWFGDVTTSGVAADTVEGITGCS